jgi:hypothetical protein
VTAWHWKVSWTLIVILAAGGYVWKNATMANDLKREVAAAVDEKLKPIAIEQAAGRERSVQQGAKLDRMSALISDALAESTAAKIREAIRKRCKAPAYSVERDNIVAELGRLRAAYEEYAGKPYVEPSCGDI